MKIIRILTAVSLCVILSLAATSCLVLVPGKSGGHKGWHKNSNNPHHPNSTNPGHTKGKSKH